MNRFFICVLMIFFLCTSGFAQTSAEEQEGFKPLLEFNGNDWMSWPEEAKAMFIGGFALAQSAITIAVVDEDNELVDLTEEEQKKIADWLFITANIYEIVYRVETWYRMTGNLDYPIWNVIYIVFDKHWWGKQKTNGDGLTPRDDPPVIPKPPDIRDYKPRPRDRAVAYNCLINFR